MRDAVAQEREPDTKPRGLWVSVGDGEDGWRAWCEAESFGLKRFQWVSEITFTDAANILWLSGADEIDRFHAEYVKGRDYERKPGWRWPPRGIDWAGVAMKYDGIVIAPYVWERRHCETAGWYYSWDCASGCIWNPAILTIVRSEPFSLPEREAAA